VQNSKVIITNSEKEKLLQQYATLCDLKFPKFIGPLPLTINKTQFDNGILSCNYAITDKADGLRKLLYVSNSGDALLIGRSNGKTLVSATIYIGNGYVHLKNSLYDGELIDDTFYIFDCLYINGKNVQQLNLIERLHNIKIKTSASVKSPSHLKMRIKSFFYRNIEIIGPTLKSVTSSSVYKHAYNVWDEKESKPYTLDGLVFTPVNAPYINNQIYKWKPTDTIDFFVLKVNKNANVETWILHIAGFDKKGNYKHYDFRGFDGRGSFSYKKDRKTLITKNTIPFALGTIQIANNTAEKYRTNTVIEFKYIKATKKFVPLQTREDKNFANGILAVNDAYFSITNPITHSGLKAGKYIYCGRKYHNAIKNHLIQKYVKKSNVLDIGVGAGGNIMKYVHANVKSLTGVDIVPVQYEFNPNKMQFFHVKNTNFYNISNILKNAKTKVFDNITCFFAIHYFFKNDKYLENLYNNVNKSLKKGGYFICTFMDEKNVTKLLNSKANYNSNVFSLQRNNEKIKVMLKGTKYFETKASSEYLVDIKRFMRFFPNFSIVERNGFESYKNQFSNEYIMMNNEEKKFSHLNISFVLQKKM
jgi:SAM-dependent methyltransferase